MFPLERLPSKGLGLFWSSAERYTDMDGLTRREHHCYGHTSKIKITFIIASDLWKSFFNTVVFCLYGREDSYLPLSEEKLRY